MGVGELLGGVTWVFCYGILLGVGTMYASTLDAKVSKDISLATITPQITPPIVTSPEVTGDHQVSRVLEELNRTKDDLRQTNAALKSLTDNISGHFISNYSDTITVVGTGIGIVAAVLGGIIAWGYGLLKEGLTKKIKKESEEAHTAMSISVQYFPLVSVQLFPLYRFAERDFCDA